MAAAANHLLQSVGEKAKKLHVSCATMHVKGRHPAEGIIETAQAQTCDLIVIVSHGRRGPATPLIGSQASRVATLSPVPVLVCCWRQGIARLDRARGTRHRRRNTGTARASPRIPCGTRLMPVLVYYRP
jgi:hypothetical protein